MMSKEKELDQLTKDAIAGRNLCGMTERSANFAVMSVEKNSTTNRERLR